MTLSGIDRGAGSRNTGGESNYVFSPSGTIAAGSLAVVQFAYDNSAAAGADPFTGISDSKGNTWDYGWSNVYSPGGIANDGVCLRTFTSLIATPILASDTITPTFSAVTVARAYVIHEVISSVGPPSRLTALDDQGGTGTGTTPTVTTTAVATIGDMVIAAMGAEGNAAITADSDTTAGSWSTQQTSGVGVTTAGMEIAAQRKVTTGTGQQTYNTVITSADWCAHYVWIGEPAQRNQPPIVAPGMASRYAGQ